MKLIFGKNKGILYSGIFFLFISCSFQKQNAAVPSADPQPTEREQAFYDLIESVVPEAAQYFEVEFVPQEGGRDAFEIESSEGDKIILRGSNGVSVASALNHYLKEFTNSQISWNGSNLNITHPFPKVPQKIRKATPFNYRYYLNYCTFNNTMVWWDWGVGSGKLTGWR